MKHFNNLFKSAVAMLGVAVLFSSCSSDNVDPSNNVALSFKGVTSTASTARLASTGYEVTEATLALKKIELEQDLEDVEDENGEEIEIDELEYDFEGPFIVDLLTETSNPEIPLSTIEAGIYHELEAESAEILDNEASIIIKGSFTAADGSSVPFEYYYQDDQDFEVENEAGFEISEATLNQVTIVFDFAAWFSGVDFTSATINESGIVLIDEENNETLYELIETNLEEAAELYEEDKEDKDEDDDKDDEKDEEDEDDKED